MEDRVSKFQAYTAKIKKVLSNMSDEDIEEFMAAQQDDKDGKETVRRRVLHD